ncbi:MAG: iron-containing alcohol dehydrogenase [Planctomycetes bacterium]|nr:iron-containing alcohol dehydrogenase [Planctomycetota bacterium]
MRFEFATAGRVLFGPGTVREAAPAAAELGRRALVVTGSASERAAPLLADLRTRGVEAIALSVVGEPTTHTASAAVESAREAACDLVIGFGGGSAVDLGKAVAAILANGGEPLDYLEVIGRGRPLTRASVPFLAIPTTAGTGSEVTRNAVLVSPQHRVKVSLRSAHLLPRLAIVDPELTYALPPDVTAATGLDALTQLIEPLVCNSPNPMTDALCRDGIARAARSLRRACENGRDATAREDLALASLFGGMALANARLGAVHGLAGPLGGYASVPAPHGALCARLLPFVLEANLRALRGAPPIPTTTTTAPSPTPAAATASAALARFDEVARLLTGRADARADDGVAWVHDLCAALRIPPLASYAIGEADLPALVRQAQSASSMKGNPVPLTDDDLAAVLRAAM